MCSRVVKKFGVRFLLHRRVEHQFSSMAAAEEGLYLASKEISHGGRIPRKFTQDAQGAVKDISPPLEWYNVPEEAVSLALIMEGPDAPDPAGPVGNPWVHW